MLSEMIFTGRDSGVAGPMVTPLRAFDGGTTVVRTGPSLVLLHCRPVDPTPVFCSFTPTDGILMIEFSREAYDAIVAHAREGSPMEICGVLGGDFGDERSRVEATYRAANVSETPETEYYIDPEEQLEITEDIEGDGRNVVGFYHSHPAGPTTPSETDAARATWPGLSYVIVCLDGEPFVGAWRWNADEERFEQEAVRID